MNFLGLVLALAAAFGQAQPNPCAAVDVANNSYGPGRMGLVMCLSDRPMISYNGAEPQPIPEPVDVPAIQLTHKVATGIRSCELIDGVDKCDLIYSDASDWTCADKSRILLTDESGGKHCIKFGNQPTETTDHGK